MSTRKALLEELAHEASHTRRLLERLPEGKLGWRPHEASMSLGRLAGHIAEIPKWTPAMMSPELDLAALAGAAAFEPSCLRDVLVELGCGVSDFHMAVGAATDEDLASPLRLRRGDRVLATMPRSAAVRRLVLQHVAHHRGQLTVYLRQLGVPLPQIYGPTADHRELTAEETEARRDVGRVPEGVLMAVA